MLFLLFTQPLGHNRLDGPLDYNTTRDHRAICALRVVGDSFRPLEPERGSWEVAITLSDAFKTGFPTSSHMIVRLFASYLLSPFTDTNKHNIVPLSHHNAFPHSHHPPRFPICIHHRQ